MEEIYANVDDVKSRSSRSSTIQEGPRRLLRASVLGLGLLSVFLLAGLIGLAVHCGAAAELSAVKANLTERLHASDQLLSSVTEERDNLTERLHASDQLINQLKANLTEKTREVDRLQCWQKTCPEGWRKFDCSCYLLSTEKASWQQSRQNCTARGADLVIVDSDEEQIFLESMISNSQINSSMINGDTWIGLSDMGSGGQPDDGGGIFEEDCVYINPSKWWDDLSCWKNLHWICEK
ncbi:hypothetical protein JOQ06_030049 [Pogonophryne albipinna]|uniref:C-type lectin domain-containing protein n=1 Tax=Pogonophryne albipinna TaxID=1090488 RepID=A0AAD6AWD9_9TELE|nr:hypothetical protein JOQ06_030049 [Pogonophryne albipinna]